MAGSGFDRLRDALRFGRMVRFLQKKAETQLCGMRGRFEGNQRRETFDQCSTSADDTRQAPLAAPSKAGLRSAQCERGNGEDRSGEVPESEVQIDATTAIPVDLFQALVEAGHHARHRGQHELLKLPSEEGARRKLHLVRRGQPCGAANQGPSIMRAAAAAAAATAGAGLDGSEAGTSMV